MQALGDEQRIVTLIWNKNTNEVDIVPDESLSYFDVLGICGQASALAAEAIPNPYVCDHCAHENETEEL